MNSLHSFFKRLTVVVNTWKRIMIFFFQKGKAYMDSLMPLIANSKHRVATEGCSFEKKRWKIEKKDIDEHGRPSAREFLEFLWMALQEEKERRLSLVVKQCVEYLHGSHEFGRNFSNFWGG